MLLACLQNRENEQQLAEEVVKETTVNVWNKADQFNSLKAAESTWIFTIAINPDIVHGPARGKTNCLNIPG